MDQTLTSSNTRASQSSSFQNKTLDYFSVEKTNGRIGRRLYFVFAILMPFLSFWMLAKISTQLTQSDIITSLFISWILALIAISIMAMVVRLTIHRCHDFGVSRWYAALSVIPFSPLIFVLIPGNSTDNNFGDKPKAPASIVKDSFFLSLIKFNDRLKY